MCVRVFRKYTTLVSRLQTTLAVAERPFSNDCAVGCIQATTVSYCILPFALEQFQRGLSCQALSKKKHHPFHFFFWGVGGVVLVVDSKWMMQKQTKMDKLHLIFSWGSVKIRKQKLVPTRPVPAGTTGSSLGICVPATSIAVIFAVTAAAATAAAVGIVLGQVGRMFASGGVTHCKQK